MKILEVLTGRRKIGNIGEKFAARLLKKKGYKILERNYVAFDSEIDIICKNKTTIAFVEVKTRTLGFDNPHERRPASAVTPEKQRKIISAAKCYLGTHERSAHARLDVVEVYLDSNGKPTRAVHIENSFNRNTANERRTRYQ